jgi:hypothetical protein
MDDSQNGDESESRTGIAENDFSINLHNKTPVIATSKLFDNAMKETF